MYVKLRNVLNHHQGFRDSCYMGGENQKIGIIKPHGTTDQLRQCDLNFCDSAVDFGPEERVITLYLKKAQVMEFRVHKSSFFLTSTCHCHTPQNMTVCKLSKLSCEHFLSLSIQLFS